MLPAPAARRSQRVAPQMMQVIQRVLRRLQEEYGVDEHGSSDSDYEPTSDDSDDAEKDTQAFLEPLTSKLVFRNAAEPADCAVCLEPKRFRQHGLRLACGHEFHKKCISAWLERDREMRCPVCRQPTVAPPTALSQQRRERASRRLRDAPP